MPFTRTEHQHFTKLALAAPIAPQAIDPHAQYTPRLPEVPRLVYRMHDVEGFGLKEIAGVMGARPAKVKRALERARSLLKAHLQ